MFNTFKYDPETRSVQELRRASDPITARSSQHQACNNCHAKKLKCSGEKDGCERCAAGRLTCEYTRSSSRRGGKKSSGRSSTDSRGGDTTGGDSSPGSQSGKSSRHKSSGRLSKQSSSKPKSHSSRYVVEEDEGEYEHQEASGTALSQLEDVFVPGDGFDMGSLSLVSASDVAATTGAGYGAGIPAFSPGGHEYYQDAEGWHSASQGDFPGSSAGLDPSFLGPNQPGYGSPEFYSNYDYSQFQQHQNDPRYWHDEHQQ